MIINVISLSVGSRVVYQGRPGSVVAIARTGEYHFATVAFDDGGSKEFFEWVESDIDPSIAAPAALYMYGNPNRWERVAG